MVAAIGLLFSLVPLSSFAATDVVADVSSVVAIECGSNVDGEFVPVAFGTGLAYGDNLILANSSAVYDFDGRAYEYCLGGTSSAADVAPKMRFRVMSPTTRHASSFDYVLAQAFDIDSAEPVSLPSTILLANSDAILLGDRVSLLGYANAGEALTVATGTVVGFDGSDLIDVDGAYGAMDGVAFDPVGNRVGILARKSTDESDAASVIQGLNAVYEDILGPELFVRDESSVHTKDSILCISDACYHLTPNDGSLVDRATGAALDYALMAPDQPAGAYVPAEFDASLQDRMLGRILLQVESHGEAWYVSPADKLRHYMPDGASAYQVMREMSLGISDANLAAIPSVTSADAMLTAPSVCATNALASQLRGKILLQVESHGEAWYVHPDTCQRVYMADGEAAYSIMRLLSLGISDANLRKMPSGI